MIVDSCKVQNKHKICMSNRDDCERIFEKFWIDDCGLTLHYLVSYFFFVEGLK